MDRQSRELMSAGAEIFHTEVSPGYAAVQEELLGRLSDAGGALLDEQEATRQKRQNFPILQRFVAQLPEMQEVYRRLRDGVYGDRDNAISVETLEEAHAVQKSAIWLDRRHFGNNPNWADPYYVVGSRLDKTSRSGDLLLFPAAESAAAPDQQLIQLSGRLKKVRNILTLQDENQLAVPPEVIKDTLYVPEKGCLVIGANSPGSLYAPSVYMPGWSHYRFSSTTVCFPSWNRSRLSVGITDEEWGQYNVPTHLNKLALLFGKHDILQSILNDEYVAEEPEARSLPRPIIVEGF